MTASNPRMSSVSRCNPCTAGSQLLPQESAFLELFERLAELVLGVHHDRTVPGDRLLQRLARTEQKSDPILTGLDDDFVAAVEKDQRPVVRFGRRRGLEPLHPFGRDRKP